MNITPPMVGVPILLKWLSGPSTRIILPILKVLRMRMSGDPQITDKRNPNPLSASASEVSFILSPPARQRFDPSSTRETL